MHHELKIWPQYYKPVSEGKKTFEVRKNDRVFHAGDTITLREFDFEWRVYTDSPKLKFKIGYVLPIDSDRVVFSLLPIEGEEG